MCRIGIARFLAVAVAGLIALAPASADDSADVQRVQELTNQVNELEARQHALLEQQVESYLAKSTDWNGADASDPLAGVNIRGSLTGIWMAAFQLNPADSHVLNGVVEVAFDFAVNENLDLFLQVESSHGTGTRFPAAFPLVGGGPPVGGVGMTFNSFSDGIGVDGTAPVTGGGAVLAAYEAGMRVRRELGSAALEIEVGLLDPRTRFHQNVFADDAKTQFVNNIFADSPSVLWLTDSTGRGSLGVHFILTFGDNDAFTFNGGWFNTAGAWFNSGQGYVQIAWAGEVNGRPMNVRLFGFVDQFFNDPAGDGMVGGGLSADWRVTDMVGAFLRLAANSGDANPIQFSASIGAVLFGLINSRPDDEVGLAFGDSEVNRNFADAAIAGVPQDSEYVIEVYYKFVAEEGKLQITVGFQLVLDPGGGGTGWLDDQLYMMTVRVHVPF